jgi:hypothetical protein
MQIRDWLSFEEAVEHSSRRETRNFRRIFGCRVMALRLTPTGAGAG